MAIQFPTSGAGLLRNTGAFLSGNANFTIMYWLVNTANAPSNPDYRAYHVLANAGYTEYAGLYSIEDINEVAFTGDDGGGTISSDFIPYIRYDAYHICYVYDNTAKTLKLYINKFLADTVSIDYSGTTFTQEFIGYDGFSLEELAVQNYRSWQRALTIAQIEAESISDNAVLATNLFCDTPLSSAADLADDSGHARNWTAVGTPTNYTTNDIKFLSATNTTASLAAVIPFVTEEGYRLTQTALVGGSPSNLFFTYTAISGDNVLGIRIYGDNVKYKPTINVYIGTALALVDYYNLQGTGYKNTPIQFPVTPGVQYWFKASFNDGTATEAPLQFQITKFVDGNVVDGDWVITDDVDNLPTCIRDITTGEVKKFIQGTASGEYGDSLETTPTYLISDENGGGDDLILYDQFFVEIDRFPIATAGIIIRASAPQDLFYTFRPNGLLGACYQITPAGVLTLISSDIIIPANQRMEAIAVSNDGSTLYYVGRDTLAPGVGLITEVHAWDLTNNVQLSDVFPSLAADDWRIFDMLVASDDTLLLCIYRFTDDSVQVINVDPSDSSILHTYSFGTNFQFPGGGTPPRISRDTASTHFRLMTHPETPNGHTKLQKIKISDGTVTTIGEFPEYEGNLYQPDDELGSYAPIRAFGNSFSCPLILAVLSATGATIIVNKIVVGADSSFDFTTSGGLSPSTFSLADGEQEIFTDLANGTYGINETADPSYTVAYSVSNGDAHGAITVADGDIINVVVTNTFVGRNPLSGIYQIVPGKRNDTLWTSFDPEETEDVKIPDPFFKTALFGK